MVNRTSDVHFSIDGDNGLEMGDSSFPSLCFNEGQEMDDSSGLELVVANDGSVSALLGTLSKGADMGVSKMLYFDVHEVVALWLFVMGSSILVIGNYFQVAVGASNPPLLSTHEDLSSINNEVNQDDVEEEVEFEWGFDEPMYIMEADMQENVSKALSRITSLKEAASCQQVTEYHGVPNTSFFSLSARNTSSIMWHIVCVLIETLPTFGTIFYGYQCNRGDVKIYVCHTVLWSTGIKLWDPGKIACNQCYEFS